MELAKPSALEKIAGSLTAETALTAVGAAVGGVLAPLLPVLSNSLAAGRQKQRVEEALHEIASELQQHADAIKSISDGQYHLVNDIVLTILHTTQAEKFQYLRAAAVNAVHQHDLVDDEAVLLARIIRDVSAQEIAFLLVAFSYKGINFGEIPTQPGCASVDEKFFTVRPLSQHAVSVAGLASLGVLHADAQTWDASVYVFSPLAAKLIALLTNDSSK